MTLQELNTQCQSCQACQLGAGRTNLVFGCGVEDAKVMFVGEGPGENEDLQGEPFVGKAGQLLDDMLKIIDLDRTKNCYIANIVKCRPPGNRDPQRTEQQACITWLRGQMDIIRPRIVVCLGRIAACALINENFRITREHGLVTEKEGIYYTATFHPSALLRDESRRPDAFGDLKVIQALIRKIAPETYGHPYR